MSEIKNDSAAGISPAADVKEKNNPRERLKEITESIERGIQELFNSENYRQYLATMSRFHRYSVNNQMLIYMQRPDASLVAGYSKWQTQFGRHVNKGEKGITIIAPTPYKKKIEEIKLDPDTKQPLRGPDGEMIKEEVEVVIPTFRPVKVFDVSQTDGRPIPALVKDLTAAVQNYDVMMEALRRSSPVPIAIEPIHDGSDGFYSHITNSISIKEGMSESQTVSTTIHEIAHAKLHSRPNVQIDHDAPRYQLAEVMGQEVLFTNGRFDRENLPEGLFCYDLREGDNGFASTVEASVTVNHFGSILTTQPIDIPEQGCIDLNEENGLNFGDGGEMSIFEFVQHTSKDRRTKEVEAESIAYAVCQYYGIETAENSFGYIAHWSANRELPELRSSLETINKTSSALITDIDRHLAEICKERGITLGETDLTPGERMYLVDDARYVHIQQCDAGFDYTLYDAHSGKQLDGGQLDKHDLTFPAVLNEICTMHDLDSTMVEACEPSMLIALRDKPMGILIEQRFMDTKTDCYGIYQLRDTEATEDLRFEPFERLVKNGQPVRHDNYELVYTAGLLQDTSKTTAEHANDLFFQFNHNHPEGFAGHSLSVSDLLAIRHNGEMHFLYVDRWGFQEIPNFLSQNPLRTAEMSTEDDMNMIDGVINNGKATAVTTEKPDEMNHHKESRRPSLRDQLKKEQAKMPAPKRTNPRKHEPTR